MSNWLSPRISDIYSNRSRHHAVQRTNQLIVLGGAISFVYAALLLLVADSMIELTVGRKFHGAKLPILLFIVYYMFNWINVSQGMLANAARRPSVNFWALGALFLATLPVSIALVPTYGAAGGILAMIVGQAASAALQRFQLHREELLS